jgi:hypothetical protein
MPLAHQTTAEHVMGAVEAVVVNGKPTSLAMITDFLETTSPNAAAAVEMAVELGLILQDANHDYVASSPLCRFTAIPLQKAALLRILLEGYRPFVVFRERLVATSDLNAAAQSTKVICGLIAHRDEIKETLVNLGSFSRALVHSGGGHYQLEKEPLANFLQTIAISCADMAQAELRIRDQLGPEASGSVTRDNVIVPLADALFKASQRDPDGAVQQAGNAFESHIVEMAGRMGVNVAGANGIVQKLARFQNPRRLPIKLIHIGNYLGAIRNAADHGAADPDIPGASWQIRDATGLEYVFVACSFIAATRLSERNQPPQI